MKKTKLLVLSAVLALGVPMTAYAFPAGKQVLIIGNRAYDITTIENRFNDPEFINYISNNYNNMYYVDSTTSGSGIKINNVFGGGIIDEQGLINKCGDRINYYSGSDTYPTDYWATQDGQYKTSADISSNPGSPINTQQFVTLEIDSKAIAGNLYLYTFKIDNIVGVPGAAYYSVGKSNNKQNFNVNASYMIDISDAGIGTGIPINIYASDMKSNIATAMLTANDLKNGNTAISGFAVKTIKINSIINPINPVMARWMVRGNMSNGGMLDCDNNYIYYVNTADGNKIYKKNSYGTENYAINNDSSGYITVYGDWVYYCNYTDGSKIYKVKTDGTQRQKISDNKGTYLNVINDKLYYINGSDGNRIYSLDSAGTSTKLGNDEAAYLELGPNNYLFYSDITDSRSLYQIDAYGNNTKVDNFGKSNPASYVNVSVNSSVAYYSSSDGNVYRSGDSYTPIKITIQTSNGLVNDKISNINISNNSMYYKSLVDGGKLYRVGSNGGVAQKISNDSVDGIFVYTYNGTKDDVYYTKSGKLYMISGDDLNGGTLPKPIAITKPNNSIKISKIDALPMVFTDSNDSSKTIDQIDVLRYLPDKVSATMSDGSIRQLPVSWDITVPKSQSGIYTYNGTVVGYGNKVIGTLAIASTSGLNDGNTTADNEIGKNDTITIKPNTLHSGDVVKVYDVKDSSKVVKTVTIDATGGAVIGGLDFGASKGSVKITVTQSGKAEGAPYYAPFGPERGSAPSIQGSNLAKTTLTDSGDKSQVTIRGIELTLSSDDQIYTGSATDATTASNDDSHWVDVQTPGSGNSWLSGVLTIGDTTNNIGGITVSANDLKFGGNGTKLFIREKAQGDNPASAPATFVINPRIPAPYGVTFDETNKMINGTSSSEEYSIDGGTHWNSCSDNNTNIGAFPDSTPVLVRTKATQATLASMETEQVMITDTAKNYDSVAITGAAEVDESTGKITNGKCISDPDPDKKYAGTDNTIVLKSSIPVNWRVTDSRGQSTDKASVQSIDSTHALLTGYENGVVNVIGTSTDGNYLQGNLNVNITNQPVITVNNTAELNNAVNSGNIKVIKLIGIGGSYNLTSLPAPASGKLTIIGQDATSMLNISGSLAGSSSFSNLNLKNMTVNGNGSNIPGAFIDGSKVANLNLDGVSFGNINADYIINQNGAAGFNINNCSFLPSNKAKTAVVISGGSLKNSSFTGNSGNPTGAGAISASGSVTIQGNTITRYTSSTSDGYAIKAASTNVIGGVSRDSWNIIDNCDIGLRVPSGNAGTLNSDNSVDVRSVATPIDITP